MSKAQAVQNGVLHHVSPSQWSTFRDCPRKWAYGKVFRAPDTSDPTARILGDKVHKSIEAYLLGEASRDSLHPSVQAAVDAGDLPSPSSRDSIYHVEAPTEGMCVAGLPVDGRIDLYGREGYPGLPFVLDHKTCKTFDYVPTTLADNWQMVTYAAWFAQQAGIGSDDVIKLKHIYYRMSGRPAHKVVSDIITPRRTLPILQEMEATTRVMQGYAGAAKPDDVPANTDACFKFGKCAYFNQCSRNGNQNKGLISMSWTRKTPTQPAPDATPAKRAVVPDPAPHQELALYIGCRPVLGPDAADCAPLETLVHERGAVLLREAGAIDLHLAPFDYGKGKGALCADLRENPPTGAYWCLRSMGDLTAAALETLIPLAARVVVAS